MPSIEYTTICSTDFVSGQEPPDALGLHDGQEWLVKNCIIDTTNCPTQEIDENTAVSWGSSGTFINCTIRGAGKLVLCGCGDADKYDVEQDKKVRFENCVFENFGRRGPEVQNGMVVTLIDCTIRNWGVRDRFDTRCFGAWAHKGGVIVAIRCRFEQTSFFQTGFVNFFRDWFAHIGQAFNDEGIRGLFRWKTYLPGVCRGLTAGPDGEVTALDCTRNHWWIRIERGL